MLSYISSNVSSAKIFLRYFCIHEERLRIIDKEVAEIFHGNIQYP